MTKFWLLITTCIYNKFGTRDHQKRMTEYIDAITKNLSVVPPEVNVIIVENSTFGPTFLDQFGTVHYTHNGSVFAIKKGTIECKDIYDVIWKYKIADDDIVIKLTGRYTVLKPDFFNHVIETANSYDAWVKFFNVSTLKFEYDDCVTGLYAIRAFHLKSFDYMKHDHDRFSTEINFAKFIRSSCRRIYEVSELGLYCKFAETNGDELIC